MNLLKKMLAREFEVKDLGILKYFLGVEVARNKKGNFSQRKYTLDLLKEMGMLGGKPIAMPMDPIQKFEKTEGGTGSPIDKGCYQRLVGKLIYLFQYAPQHCICNNKCIRPIYLLPT